MKHPESKTAKHLLCVMLILFTFVHLLSASQATASSRPSMVLFLADDMSVLDCSAYGSKDMRTPNMQRVADAGLTFDRAFVASPSCAPSRAALLTGLMPARNGAEANHAHPRRDVKKWPAYFQELGYEVVAFGKVAHYQQTIEYGFDLFAHDTFHDHQAIPAALEYLKHRDHASTRPLCLIVGTNWPHVPWPETIAGFNPASFKLPAGSIDTTITRKLRAEYAAAVSEADKDLGAVYDTAHALLPKDTLYLFSSDHGAQWPFAKWNCYDAGIRVPMMIEWAGKLKAGTRTSAMVSWIDLLPTLLEAAGGTAPSNIDGQSFYKVLTGKETEHRDKIYTTHTGDGHWNIYPTRSLRTAQWKYILNLHPEFAFTCHIDLPGELTQRDMWVEWMDAGKTDTRAAAIVKRYHARPSEELYDLTSDPDEQKNLAEEPTQHARLGQMRTDLKEWMRAQDDQTTVPAPPRLLSDPTAYGPGAKLSK